MGNPATKRKGKPLKQMYQVWDKKRGYGCSPLYGTIGPCKVNITKRRQQEENNNNWRRSNNDPEIQPTEFVIKVFALQPIYEETYYKKGR